MENINERLSRVQNNYSKELFYANLQGIDQEAIDTFNSYAAMYNSINSHQENIVVRNNTVGNVMGRLAQKQDDFHLKLVQLAIIFNDSTTEWFDEISDLGYTTVAAAFNTSEDNVVMYELFRIAEENYNKSAAPKVAKK